MSAPDHQKDLYKRVGIDNRAEFYRQRYASSELLNADYFDAINRFDIRWARTMWIYDNVRAGATVLDLGCGSGVLALLKRKDIKLIGVDLAQECAAIARSNGYDAACVADLTHLPFADASFDYVVSLDVLGHVEFDLKDAVIGEMKRVLKPEGETLHGIEILNRELRRDYAEMTESELQKFVQIDGHVGMESEDDTQRRFKKFFANVAALPRFAICQSAEELLKQADEYDTNLCDADLLDYLRHLSFAERQAFNMAMGFVFQKISDLNVPLPLSEYSFLKASDVELGPFYNAHRDRSGLHPASPIDATSIRLDDFPNASFETGWYGAENFPPVARWMSKIGRIRFLARRVTHVTLDVTSHIPDLAEQPLKITFLLDSHPIHELSVSQNGWQTVDINLAQKEESSGEHLLELRADRTWQPRSTESGSSDSRDLSIAVCNIVVS